MLLDHGVPRVFTDIQGAQRTLIVDSGSIISILQPGVAQGVVNHTSHRPYGATGKTLPVQGEQKVSFHLNNIMYRHKFLICDLPSKASGLLGIDFLLAVKAELDQECSAISLSIFYQPVEVHQITKAILDRQSAREECGMAT
jgi:hypothetical protein